MNPKDCIQFKNFSKKFAVLYVDDDKNVSMKMKNLLEEFFDRCDLAFDGKNGIEVYKSFKFRENRFYDVVITDIVMPHMDGVTFCKELLQINKKQEIIVISAYGNKNELIELINIGIKRFIEKPFTSQEMIIKLKNVLTHICKNKKDYKISLAENLEWNTISQKLFFNNQDIKLTYKETIILESLILYPNNIFSKFDLFNIIEDDNLDKEYSQDIIKTFIKRLRKKLPFNIIKNIYGEGYKLQIE